jgi:NTE family protein
MAGNEFIKDTEVRRILRELRRHIATQEIIFSDIIDDEGHQYVDLVMEGGGLLGIALVGYTYVLEEVGIRYLGIGGTSAGSINALLLAALGPPAEAKSEKIAELLANVPINDFRDGKKDVNSFIEALIAGVGLGKLLWRFLPVVDNLGELKRNLGANPGQQIVEYFSDVLREAGVDTNRDLRARLQTLPTTLQTRDGVRLTVEGAGSKLAIVAADISTETKVEFPRMAPMYWVNADQVNPVLFLRASMSIPLFFYPFQVENIPLDDQARKQWDVLAGYSGQPPSTIYFVDGGTMSNFPIDLFHTPNTVPLAPTFGVKLGSDQRKKQSIGSFQELGLAIFNAARHTLDYDFIIRNPDYRHLVAYVDTDDHDWLNFEMSRQEQMALFLKGVRAADEFLRNFDWEGYKQLRRQLSSTVR